MENNPKNTVKPWKSFRLGAVKGLDARYHKVYNIERDGECLRVQFVREDGEIVIGCYKRIGWSWAPSEDRAELVEMLSSPPVTVFRGEPS